uniref:Zgc:77056 n=1 Tax=Oryzias sinensis TaxID=183150 RepID=A0A8C7WN54_9TELE
MDKKRSGGVSWVKPAEPTFLKKFKTDVGYKEGPNVDTKRQVIPTPEDDSGSDREDEQPQVVVLTDGDLSAEMIKDIKAGGAAEKDEKSDGKILFKKPAKRSSAEKFQGISASSSKKKKKKEDDEEEGGGEREGVEKKAGKKIKNISLLSFGGDDEDEED